MPDGFRRSFVPLVCWLVGLVPVAGAEAPPHPVVAGFERFGSDPALGGPLLLGELNCTACHRATPAQEAHIDRKQAPILDGIGGRARVSYLRAFLADPAATKPGTTMPDPLAGRDAREKAAIVEALTHFLATTGRLAEKAPRAKSIEAGKLLYHRIGCAVCHGRRDGEAATLATTIPLGDPAAKYSIPSLSAFLLDPHRVRPSGRMPGLIPTAEEAADVASYLLKEVRVESDRPNLRFAYYEGSWQRLPDFAALKPKSEGLCYGFDLNKAERDDEFALRFSGTLQIDREGEYTFHISSDDGSRLLVDGRPVATHDGLHPAGFRSGSARLDAGPHRVVVEYFEASGQNELSVEFEGLSLGRQDLVPSLSIDGETIPAKDVVPPFAPDPALAAKGRELFASVGCASCHELKDDGKPIEPTTTARPLAMLGSKGGCLAPGGAKGVPDFHLNNPQRAALASAIGDLNRSPAAPKAEVALARSMAAFNCYACHRRGGLGGPEEARDASFETTQKEMGEEGRIPPWLDGVGAKLNAAYLNQVLAEGAKDRPYMLTRMPKFGEPAAHLANAFEALDPAAPVAAVTFDDPDGKVKATGRAIVGSKGLGCIACHTFRGVQAQGIQAIDMASMTKRLRRDWFHRYLPDPAALRPGTRMPSGWPMGQSMLPRVLAGDPSRQIESVWLYLSDGGAAAFPAGLGRDPIPLIPAADAIVYRNFIEGAGPRAIGVGYPEKASLAFDAADLRLALIWQGDFIDASKHWIDRGSGFQGPLGDNVVSFPDGPAFAVLKGRDDAWPAKRTADLAAKFRGYRLGKAGKPTFLYDVGPLHVEDFPDAVAGKDEPTLRRTFTLSAKVPVKGVYFRAAVADAIEPAGDGWYAVGKALKMRLVADEAPTVRKAGGHAELLVPIRLREGKGQIVQEIAW